MLSMYVEKYVVSERNLFSKIMQQSLGKNQNRKDLFRKSL